jgi:cation diffusion facilitator family transporter
MSQRRLFRLLWLSIAAAIATISLKTVAWALTGSVGLLSDAAESVINLLAALFALGALRWALKPADEEHAYGHAKAEYFSAGAEGALILVAAAAIAVTAVERLLNPRPVEDVEVGLAVSAAASLINLAVGFSLVRTGRAERSITLEADGRHLMTDVWTSIGVIVGVAAVAITGFERLDALVALAVATNIVLTGSNLVRRSAGGLMDRRLGDPEQSQIAEVLGGFAREGGLRFHALRTRQAGSRAFISFHLLVPGDWTVQQGHDAAEEVEAALRAQMPYATVFSHLEPIEDPRSFGDEALERSDAPHDTSPRPRDRPSESRTL